MDEMKPVLTRDEIAAIRAKLDAGTVDELDIEALLYQIDVITDSYEDLVRRSAEEANRTTALVLAKEEDIVSLTKEVRYLESELRDMNRLAMNLTRDY